MVKKKGFWILFILVVLDQFTKLLIHIKQPSLDLKLLAITFVRNTGSVWGLFQDVNMIFIWISIIAIGLLLYFGDRFPEKGRYFYWTLIAGITGNLIDRIFRGFVVDFINFKFWPVFNIADACIVISIIALIYFVWKDDNKN